MIFRLFQLGISKVSRELESSKRKADGLYAPNMGLNTSQSVPERYNTTINEPHGRISVKIVQNSSKWPLAGDIQAISRSLGSSQRSFKLYNYFYYINKFEARDVNKFRRIHLLSVCFTLQPSNNSSQRIVQIVYMHQIWS